jgi:hypothetical protein
VSEKTYNQGKYLFTNTKMKELSYKERTFWKYLQSFLKEMFIEQ